MLRDILKYVGKSLFSRLSRSGLTIASILVGIMAIYSLLSFGQGLTAYVDSFAEKVGTDKLIAQPKSFGPPGTGSSYLSEDDLKTISRINGVKDLTGMYITQAQIKDDKRKKGKWVFVIGFDASPGSIRLIRNTFGTEIELGRELKKADSKKAAFGYSYLVEKRIFNKPLKLGDKVYINDVPFKAAGFYEQIGNPTDDSYVYLNRDDFEELFNKSGEYSYVIIQAEKGKDINALSDIIEEKLRKEKGQKEGEEDFFVQTFQQQIETFNTVITILNAILVLIAAVSVVVAAVNITNTMYTSVLERTKEIGVMKAIGARNSTIMLIFVLESGILGIIGGMLGVLFGYILSSFGGKIVAIAGYTMLKPVFPLWLNICCIAFAFLIGSFAGFFPAKQASKLKPVDALRYE